MTVHTAEEVVVGHAAAAIAGGIEVAIGGLMEHIGQMERETGGQRMDVVGVLVEWRGMMGVVAVDMIVEMVVVMINLDLQHILI